MQKIKNIVKHNQFLGIIYLTIFRFLFNVLQKFIKIDPKLILLTSYSGRQVSDSPFQIYKDLKADPRFSDYKFLWGVVDKNDADQIPTNEKVEIDSIKFIFKLLKSKYWISNTSIERLINFDHRDHVYINTWHGIPMKHLGPDESNLEFLVKNWFHTVKFDLLYSSGDYDQQIFKRIFPQTEKIVKLGLPRNKELLVKETIDKKRCELSKRLHLDPNKETLLYAPTFREYNNVGNTNVFTFPFDKKTIHKINQKYNFLVRGHYFIEDLRYNSDENSFVDVSSYPDINDLFAISDVLISDYSSLIFDYSLLQNRRIILYLSDIDEYIQHRGFYLDPRELDITRAFNLSELMDALFDYDINAEWNKTKKLSECFNENFDMNSEYLKHFILNWEQK
jgi:CDP-glycerol glycerophosphotransferase